MRMTPLLTENKLVCFGLLGHNRTKKNVFSWGGSTILHHLLMASANFVGVRQLVGGFPISCW